MNIVQEIQGLYGPFTISERVLQKIWLEGDFHQDNLRTSSGKSLEIIHPGQWNFNEGPDFKEACLKIDGIERVGDVEIHFQTSDWFSHRHDRDKNFRQVILHVLLSAEHAPSRGNKADLETITLLPLLERDLEEYAMEDALLELEQVNNSEWIEHIKATPLHERQQLIEQLSHKRWKEKAAFAAKRLKRHSWQQCCHECALEVLGYSRNRSPMNRIAGRYSIEFFAQELDIERAFIEENDSWRLKSIRPANHPKLRLQQYANVCRNNPQWPEQVMKILADLNSRPCKNTSVFRKENATKALQNKISEVVFSGQIGEKRLNTLLCDALFPLAEAALQIKTEDYWLHWYPGDYPASLGRTIKNLSLAQSGIPVSNGLCQGLLRLIIDAKAH